MLCNKHVDLLHFNKRLLSTARSRKPQEIFTTSRVLKSKFESASHSNSQTKSKFTKSDKNRNIVRNNSIYRFYSLDTSGSRKHNSLLVDNTGGSNRKKFSKFKPSDSILDYLDQNNIGKAKLLSARKRENTSFTSGKKNEKSFRARIEPIKLPKFKFVAGATSWSSFPASDSIDRKKTKDNGINDAKPKPSSNGSSTLPEIAFIGRSNVGKSSLINKIGNTSIARVSDTPGETQQLNFYNCGREFYFVDMPGYGFAHTTQETKSQWLSLIESYIDKRKNLKRLMVLIDARHGIKIKDQEFLNMLEEKNVKYQLIMTKCDLVKREELAKRYLLVLDTIKNTKNCIQKIHLTSIRNPVGLELLKRDIVHSLGLGKKYLVGVKKSNVINKLKFDRSRNR